MDFLLIGLTRTRDELRQRIAARTQVMLNQGLEAEVRQLLSRGFPPTLPALQSVGYREMMAYLRGEVDLQQACTFIEHNTWRLAKRQMTWFRHISGVHWLSLTEVPAATAIEAIIGLIARSDIPVYISLSRKCSRCVLRDDMNIYNRVGVV
jgi:tRNA dimethylallyltransferase